MSGNVLLGHARLNVPDGLRRIYQQPWPAGHHEASRLTAVDRDVEVSRAEVVDGVLHARLRRDRTVPGDGTVTLAGLPAGTRLRLGGAEITPRACS
ncbi:hypothetical protein LWC35_00870 [Pseudonocardia kujensis]|uniref:hypothetical protein n=1 Tax=Pseudonocardia kujensis TaxID=1128675 RepID=UPI001E5A747E|nr:hypothetical protein [Pseudonocardia kujensis]MCE0761474.1 hypothetical protein [Pseudonocardia kujensis]